MKARIRFLILLALLIFAAGIALSGGAQHKASPDKKELKLFSDALSIIETDYVEPDKIGQKKLVYGALHGMVSQLDPYSQFLEPDEFKGIKAETKGEFGGIGVEVSIRGGILTVVSPLDSTPAAKAGVLAGDKIVRIDEAPTKDMKLHEAVKKLRGRPGTAVKLALLRDDEKKPFDIAIKRAIIKVQSVKDVKIIDQKNKTGYIKIAEFQDNTAGDLDVALAKLKKQGIKALVLDLRNNPGGLLEVAITVAEKFIPADQVICSTKGASPSQNVVFKSEGKGIYTQIPVLVLVNKGSASGSEIVAGAVQDYKRGAVIGTNTFGKGSVQTVVPLSDGSALRLTTAKFYTPKGRPIGQDGIAPDVTVEQTDEQLKKALDILIENGKTEKNI